MAVLGRLVVNRAWTRTRSHVGPIDSLHVPKDVGWAQDVFFAELFSLSIISLKEKLSDVVERVQSAYINVGRAATTRPGG